MREGMNVSPARVFFGFAVFVAAFAFLADAMDFPVFDTNSFLFVVVGAVACCVIACSMETMRSGVMCFGGKNDCDPVQACGFWTSFGTYAWWCGLMAAFMSCVAYAEGIRNAASFDVVMVPMMYCLAYGMFFRIVGMSIACAVCNNCVPGGVCGPMNAANTNANNAVNVNANVKSGTKKKSEENVAV